jgi:glutathione S-transferase
MMKLYFSPGACSLAPHIILEEMGVDYQTVKVDLAKKTTAEGDYTQVNPKGYVPALKMDNGQLLTEDAVILQYLADLKPELGLIPAAGGMERYRFVETLNFIATELHKGFSPLFGADRMVQNKEGVEQLKKFTIDRLGTRFKVVEGMLTQKPYIGGDKFSVADAYLFTILRWAKMMHVPTNAFPKLEAYYEKVAKRPSVEKVFSAEGLH